MFTGIVETLGILHKVTKENRNIHLFVESNFSSELKIDQSVSHNGVCLTVVEVMGKVYRVVAVQETLEKTTIGNWSVGEVINLERGMRLGDRLDGHIVQGHIDQRGICTSRESFDGSTVFSFSYNPDLGNLTIEKGSICVNGVSLTVVDSKRGEFSVCVIPHTMEHTNFKYIERGVQVNLEFDVLGKYLRAIKGL